MVRVAIEKNAATQSSRGFEDFGEEAVFGGRFGCSRLGDCGENVWLGEETGCPWDAEEGRGGVDVVGHDLYRCVGVERRRRLMMLLLLLLLQGEASSSFCEPKP